MQSQHICQAWMTVLYERNTALMASLGGHCVFALLLIGLGKKFFWVKQQCIAALCGALTRVLCRPLQPLETSSCYQVAQLAAKDLIDLL